MMTAGPKRMLRRWKPLMWGLAAVGLAAAWGRSENVGDAIGITTRSGNCYFFATHPGGIAIACRPVTIGVPFGMWTFPMPSEVAGRHWITFRWVDQVYSTRERYADLGAFPPGWKQPPPWAPVRWPPPQHGWAGLGWSSVASVPGPWPLRVATAPSTSPISRSVSRWRWQGCGLRIEPSVDAADSGPASVPPAATTSAPRRGGAPSAASTQWPGGHDRQM